MKATVARFFRWLRAPFLRDQISIAADKRATERDLLRRGYSLSRAKIIVSGRYRRRFSSAITT